MKPWNGNATFCREWLEAREKERLTVLSGQMVEEIKGMAIAIGKHPLAPQFLRGQVERTIVMRDAKTGVFVKIRPDSIPTDSGDFCDLKTCTSVQYRDLARDLGNYHYHVQGALARMACREVLGIPFSTFTLLYVEKKRPYNVRDLRLKDNDLDRGERQIRMALDIFADCLKRNSWPGPGAGNEGNDFIELPEAEQQRIDDRLERLTKEEV
jgi:hypothetical protein